MFLVILSKSIFKLFLKLTLLLISFGQLIVKTDYLNVNRMKKNSFKLSKDYTFMSNVKECNITFKCTYISVVEKANFVSLFILVQNVFIEVAAKG